MKKRRYVCPNCNKRFYENVDFLPTYYRTTNRLWAYILNELSKTRSMSCIAKDVNLSTTSIMRILDKVSCGMNHLPTTLAIDEFRGNAQGEKFQTLLTNPKRKVVLDVLPTRKQEDILEYFSHFLRESAGPEDWLAGDAGSLCVAVRAQRFLLGPAQPTLSARGTVSSGAGQSGAG